MIGLLLAMTVAAAAGAQSPTGVITGIVVDPSGAVMAGARVSIVNPATGQTREVTTSPDGTYTAAALPPGAYRVDVEADGFKHLERAAAVEAGTTTTVDLILDVGDVGETVTVKAAAPLLRYDHHQVAGVVRREQIDNVPLNGRNFLELSRLEPGVTNPVRGTNNRTFVAPLGSGLQTIPRIGYTRITVDGASINVLNTIGAGMQVSQDVVQEFQISTANFDVSTGTTTNGAINIVTRSGGNRYGGSGFSYYRDHRMAAYPALRRDPDNPDPFFRRHQFGAAVGGPIRRDRAFLFASYERHDQRGVISVQPNAADFAPLGGIFPTPYHGNLFTGRLDARLSDRHTAFARTSYDGNEGFSNPNVNNVVLPSGWSHETSRVVQTVIGLTSVLSSRTVNEARASYISGSAPGSPADADDCPGCVGLGAPRITFQGLDLALGQSRRVTFGGHRYQLTDSVMWQIGRHGLRFGADWEHTFTMSGTAVDRDLSQVVLWTPSDVRNLNPSLSLPPRLGSLDDLLRLPLRSFLMMVGPAGIPQRDFLPYRVTDVVRLFVSDTWRIDPRVTVTAGLAWFLEPNALNDDLTKPALLIPLLGADRLNPPSVRYGNFSPALGLAWTATRDGKTVVRGGGGRYFDPAGSTNATNLDMERSALLPVGTTLVTRSSSNLSCNGQLFDFPQPTGFTGADLLAALPCLRAQLPSFVNPGNRDFSVRNLDVAKEGRNLSDPGNQTPSAFHAGAGVQRELATGLVVSADFVWKRFLHTFINGIDYNRFTSAAGPIIPRCGSNRDDPAARCSNGPLRFDTTIGRARYAGLLLRIDERVSANFQVLASYALSSYVGTNGTGTGTAEMTGGRAFGFNNDDWFENEGPLPTDQRHILNVSGFAGLPWRFKVGFSISAYTRPPFSVFVSASDFNGDGTTNDLLPGTRINQFGRSLSKDDLVRLVAAYNREIADRLLCCGQRIPRALTLPADYSFDDFFFTQDVRLSRSFPLPVQHSAITLSLEVFNLFNTANLTGFSGNVGSPELFGRPNARVNQAFGSGGPRAFQLAARVTY